MHTKSPTGGKTGRNMLVKESDYLIYLAKLAGKSTEQFAQAVFPYLVESGLLEKEGDYWGASLSESIPGETAITKVFSAMVSLGIMPKFDNYKKFVGLVLILDGECNNCGYDMEVIDSEDELIGGDGYHTPYEYRPIWETKKCLHCGYVRSNEPIF